MRAMRGVTSPSQRSLVSCMVHSSAAMNDTMSWMALYNQCLAFASAQTLYDAVRSVRFDGTSLLKMTLGFLMLELPPSRPRPLPLQPFDTLLHPCVIFICCLQLRTQCGGLEDE